MNVRVLDPNVSLSDPRAARMAAEAIILYGLNYERAAREIRPDLAGEQHNYFARKLRTSRHVQRELEKLMSTPERNASRFVQLMWDWLEVEGIEHEIGNGQKVKLLDKASIEMKQTAARILARGYINEKAADKPAGAPMVLDIGRDGVAALTGEKLDSKKVM